MTQEALQKINGGAVVAQTPAERERVLVKSKGAQSALTVRDIEFYAAMVETAGLISKSSGNERQAKAQAMVKIIAGHAYGLDPIVSMSMFDIIDGRVKPTGEMQMLLVNRSGKYRCLPKVREPKECILEWFAKAGGAWSKLGESFYTWELAEKAQLIKKDNYIKHPADMMFWRAFTRGRKMFCAEVVDTGGYFDGEPESDEPVFTLPAQLESGEIVEEPETAEAEVVDEKTDGDALLEKVLYGFENILSAANTKTLLEKFGFTHEGELAAATEETLKNILFEINGIAAEKA